MALEKLKIIVEKTATKLDFDNANPITVLFNPSRLTLTKSASWERQKAAQHDTPELQFTSGEPRTLKLDLFFDTYDTPSAIKKDVRDDTNQILRLITVEGHGGEKHRPPVCRLAWGAVGVFFQGVLESLEQQFTLFMENGTPVRATLNCSFKEWYTNYDDLNRQNRLSSDVAKTRIVKRGDSLSSIAAEVYFDPGLWRPIASENDIDDPRCLTPGTVLLIPTLSQR